MTSLLLPKLKDDCDVKSGNSGSWNSQGITTFNQVASSLDYKAPGEVKSVSSVPTVWARPLSVEMALHNDAYPIREQMIIQWQGMLAALALAEVRNFPIKAQLLELGTKKTLMFLPVLFMNFYLIQVTPFSHSIIINILGKTSIYLLGIINL
ncbi:hypothetical protein [Anabaena sp. UHCC 0253]|uniref:hypothetical protein n=1 Tax=Anabaena sp. UHCC 0253 TaxID=2590019 RepID=UPI001C2BC013|nr:hypothetical protein [Anabaena sp. UHCC 0253]